MNRKLIFILLACLLSIGLYSESIFIEAESFEHTGGWVIDNQAYVAMGSPYLMAHGMGQPVANATTTVNVSKSGKYRIWVRTRNWVKSWNKEGAPGRFKVIVNEKSLNTLFGTEKAEWHWQDGGVVSLKKGILKLELEDLTGFNGRCDAIFLTNDLKQVIPNDKAELSLFRKQLLKVDDTTEMFGKYDLVVVGGGIAGCTAALSAARLGCKVALIQNRSVLGGNNSSEVRVGLSGLIMQEPYPNLGILLDELGPVGHWNEWEAKQNPDTERSKQIKKILKENTEKKIHNAGPTSNYEDQKKLYLIQQEKNITLFLNTEVFNAETVDNIIKSVTARNIISGKELVFEGKLFSDCTGDGTLGYLAGANYRTGRESRSESGESLAPEKEDNLVMGTSVQWYAEKAEATTSFPSCPWAMQFDESNCFYLTRGDWDWEAGIGKDQIQDIEYIRDLSLRAIYGNWDYVKNKSLKKEAYSNQSLKWVAYIGGKRESRRLIGDIVLKEQDIMNQVAYDDASFTTTWPIDLHYPKEIKNLESEDPFIAYFKHNKIKPYAVPYRCLYSNNINNLFMAGRNISVTHVALGTVRVQRTTGMMGEVVGMAASLCIQNNVTPRDIYRLHLPELIMLMKVGVGKSGF